MADPDRCRSCSDPLAWHGAAGCGFCVCDRPRVAAALAVATGPVLPPDDGIDRGPMWVEEAIATYDIRARRRERAGKWVRPAADGCVDGHTFTPPCEMAVDVPGPWDSTTMGTTG